MYYQIKFKNLMDQQKSGGAVATLHPPSELSLVVLGAAQLRVYSYVYHVL